MRDREILRNEGNLCVLLDSRSFEAFLNSGSQHALRLIRYHWTSPFEFVRSPFQTSDEDLERVAAFEWRHDKRGLIDGIRIERRRLTSKISLTSDSQSLYVYVQIIGRTELGKENLSEAEKEAILLVIVGEALGRREAPVVLVTDNSSLLKHRMLLESRFGRLGQTSPFIVTVKEALEILDLYAKYQNKHLIASYESTSKWFWYWLSFRSKIPHYQVRGPIQNALAGRYVFLLMSIDEMGFQYYSRANNSAMMNIVYHFNYAITLITGIFDSLALTAQERLRLRFENDNRPERTSLNPSAGKDFLKALRKKNGPLRDHINDYVLFIKLIYDLREKVIHREMLEETGFEDMNERWRANLLRIDQEAYNLIRQVGDQRMPYEPFTRWGTHSIHSDWFLEPFHFGKEAVETLGAFCDRFLELLGYGDFLKELEESGADTFLEDMQRFRDSGLRSLE